jgi:hypothetical protein
MKTVTYHIIQGTNSHGKKRSDTMVRIQVEGNRWNWFTGFADASAALSFVKELVRGHNVELVAA